MPIVGREPGDRVEGRVVVAFYRKRSKERVVPMTRSHRGTMSKLYQATCIIEVPYRIRGRLR
ncbi:MAG: hypothetical protein ACE5Z5_01035 [Candidatus Bathyarchaeia archaeon]